WLPPSRLSSEARRMPAVRAPWLFARYLSIFRHYRFGTYSGKVACAGPTADVGSSTDLTSARCFRGWCRTSSSTRARASTFRRSAATWTRRPASSGRACSRRTPESLRRAVLTHERNRLWLARDLFQGQRVSERRAVDDFTLALVVAGHLRR